MKQLLFLLLFPAYAVAQYPGNANQKITLGEQTTADGLVYRGVASIDTVTATSKITRANKQDTSAFLLLDTVTNLLWHYKTASNGWIQAGGSTLDTATMLLPYYRAGRNTIIQAADVPTLNQNTTGSAATLTTGRTIQTNLASTSAATFNGSANITPGVTGTLPVANGGTGATNLSPNNYLIRTNSSGVFDTSAVYEVGGNVGIGSANPNALLEVSKTGNFTAIVKISDLTSESTGVLVFGDGTSDLIVCGLWRAGANSFTNIGNYTNIAGYDGITFSSSNDFISSSSVQSERMRITSGGEVWIGYTTDQGAYPLQVNGQIFATNATIATSDEKFKENITPLNKGLEIVNKLKPVTFNFISNTENNFSEYEEVGFIAQDVDRALSTETFSKSIVKAADDSELTSTMGLATQNLIPILVKAIQEQQALIKALEQRIINLENK